MKYQNMWKTCLYNKLELIQGYLHIDISWVSLGMCFLEWEEGIKGTRLRVQQSWDLLSFISLGKGLRMTGLNKTRNGLIRVAM